MSQILSGVLTVLLLLLKIQVFLWDMIPCHCVSGSRHSQVSQRLHLHSQAVQEEIQLGIENRVFSVGVSDDSRGRTDWVVRSYCWIAQP
jgi:hypothetical protein